MKCRIVGLVWLLATRFNVSYGARSATAECHCGFGGLCIKDAANNPFVFDCGLCPMISGNFYDGDCTTIRDHCHTSPCIHGVCVPTFGSYYCKCPADYFGRNCSYHEPIFTSLGVKNDVHVYYQVQPYDDGTNEFHIVYNPLNERETSNEPEVSILVIVEFENGKVMYPDGKHFALRNIKETCSDYSRRNHDLYDVNICDILPEGEVRTFSFESTLYYHSYIDPRHIISLPGIGKIGRSESVKLRIEATDFKDMREVLYEETFVVFTYSFFGRIPNNCNIDVDFKGCSLTKLYPSQYSLGDRIIIGGITENMGCKGILDLGKDWFLQKNIDRLKQYPFDRMPKIMRDSSGNDVLSFRRRYFKPGLHSIGFVHNLRGNPPMIGGSKLFRRTSGCWIKTVTNVPSFGTEGGSKRTASCFQSLRLKVILYDNNYDLSDFTFMSSCTSSTMGDDEECLHRNLAGPYLNKFFTPCNTDYNYTIWAIHRLNVTPIVTLNVYVAFIPAETELQVQVIQGCGSIVITFEDQNLSQRTTSALISSFKDGSFQPHKGDRSITKYVSQSTKLLTWCIYNCNPIDPEMLVLVGAWTIPYVPQSVTWNVTMDGTPLHSAHYHTTGFQRSSRILRVDGANFRFGLRRSVTVEFSASKGENRIFATLSSSVDILDSYISKFVMTTNFIDGNPVSKFSNTSIVDFLFNNPMVFTVYSFDEFMREMILEIETSYITLIRFTPLLKKVTFCLMDSSLTLNTRRCARSGTNVEHWKLPEIHLDQLEQESRIGNTKAFLRHTQGYLIINLGGFGDHSTLKWSISLEERIQILNFMRRYDLSRQFDIMASLSILSMMFYSEAGCADQSLLKFVPDLNILSNFDAASTWLKMCYEALNVLEITVGSTHSRLSDSVLKMRDYGFGDIFDKLVSTWTLAFVQETFIDKHAFIKKNPTIRDLYLTAYINFWRIKNRTRLDHLGMFVIGVIVGFQNPFYGLRYIGRGAVRIWVTNAPYSSIVTYTNKSNPSTSPFPKLVEYIFSTPAHEEMDWVSLFSLSLPANIPGLEYEKLSFVVAVIRNLPGDETVSPTLVIHMTSENGSAVSDLPGDSRYQLIIPEMENGELTNKTTQITKGKFIVVKDPSRTEQFDYRSLSAYKLKLPLIKKKFIFFLYQETPIPIKARIFYGSLPDYGEVANTSDVVGEFDETIRLYAVQFKTEPPPGETVYLGLLPSAATPVGIHSFWGQEYVNYCVVTEHFGGHKFSQTCVPSLLANDTNKTVAWKEIHCACQKFGVVHTTRNPLEQIKVLVDPIYFVTVKELNVQGVSVFSVLLLTSVIVMMIAVSLDRKRGKERILIYVEDAYPTDNLYTLVVGIFTGSNPLACTSSSVAIKIMGSNASSRVHILNCPGKRSFRSGGDDWFVIPTSMPLGKITTVSMWLNFKNVSDWYCSGIMIYEVNTSKWYFVNVESWFKMYPTDEETKMLTLSATRDERPEYNASSLDYNFATYYFKEIRNTHLPTSLFYLHRRSLSNYEYKCLLYIVKVYGVIFWTWLSLDYSLKYIFPGHTDEQLQTCITVENHTVIFLIALSSRVFTFPLHILERWKLVSGFIQRRTTQPLFTFKGDKNESQQSTSQANLITQKVEEPRSSQRTEKQRPSDQSLSSNDFRKEAKKRRSWHDSGWTKSIFQGRSTLLVPLTVGPHQFRSVNVSLNVIEQKTRRNRNITRAFAASLLLCLVLFLAYIEFFTLYWRKTRMTCFFVGIILFFDALFVDPFLILVKSFIAYVLFNLSNKEENIWNDEAKQELSVPPTLGFRQYLEKATRKEYQPLTGAEFDEKRKQFACHKAIVLYFYYAIMLLSLCACFTLMQYYDAQSKWTAVRTMESLFSDPVSEYGNKGLRITDVYTRQKFEDYVNTNLAAADITWPNGKYIGLNQSSPPVPTELNDYLSGADALFSESRQETRSTAICHENTYYTIANNGSVLGRSGAEYPFAGHTLNFPVYPWNVYYMKLRFCVDDMLRSEDIVLRAIIFTTNYLNRNRPSFTTVDVVVELLPSGLLSAVTHVSSSIAYSNRLVETATLRTFMACIGVIMSLFNVYLLCKPIDFLGKWLTCRMWMFSIACFAEATFLGFVRHKKYVVLNSVSLNYDLRFIDIHKIYAVDLWDQCLLSTIMFVISLEIIVQVYRLMGSGKTEVVLISSFRIVLAALIITFFQIAVYEACHYHNDPRLHPVALFVFMKQFLPLLPENSIYLFHSLPGLLEVMVIFVQIMMTFCTAVAVFYFSMDVGPPTVIKYTHRILRKRGGGSFEPYSIKDGFCNGLPPISTINKETNNIFQLNIDKKKLPIQLLSSNIDDKLLWLVNK